MKPTLEELSQWTDEQLRVKCAELRGWTKLEPYQVGKILVTFDVWQKGEKRGSIQNNTLPNYPTDLNACTEFEKPMNPEQGLEYRHNIEELMQQWMLDTDAQGWLTFYVTTAPAKMRSIAYIFTTWK